MTIDSAYFPEKRNNHGGTTYRFEFEIIDPTYIEVYSIDGAGVYTLVPSINYTVTLARYIAPISRGGTVTFLVPLASTVAAISIQRKTDITDEQTFPAGLPFNAESFEFQADKLTMILQELTSHKCDCSANAYPLPGASITARLINTGVLQGGPESYLAVYQNKILFKKFADQLVYSDDSGASWTTMGLIPNYASGYRCQKLEYHVASGFWFMLTVNSVTDMAIHRSPDNGATWTAMTMPTSATYSTTSMIIDSFGRLVLSARSGLASPNDGLWIYRWDTPTTSLTRTVSFQMTTSSHNIDNLKELVGFGYALSRWTGVVQNVQLVPYAMASSSQITAGLMASTFDNIPWSYSFNGKVYAWHSAVSNNPRFLSIFNGMTSTPAYLTYDFAENTEAYRVQAAGNYLLMISQPTAVSSVWRLAYSLDAVTWISEMNLLLPNDPATDDGLQQVNLYKAGGAKWIAQYVSGGIVQLISFDFI